MGNLLFLKHVALTDFFIRRFSRVLPTFLVFVVVMLVYAATIQPRRYGVGNSELLATLLFARTYLPIGESIWADNWPIGHFWSLNVEEHSYIYLALGAMLLRTFRRQKLATFFLLASCIAIVITIARYSISPPAGSSPWFARSECAALGLIAAALIRSCRDSSKWPAIKAGHALVPVLTTAAGGVCFLTSSDAAVLVVGPLLLAIAINYLDCAPKIIHTALSWKPIRWLGMASFSLYLWQQPFYLAYTQFGFPRQLAGVFALLVGAVSFYLIENPARCFINATYIAWRRPNSKRTSARTAIPVLTESTGEEIVAQVRATRRN